MVDEEKNALFHNGVGRGDYRKFNMGFALNDLQDSTQAREIFDRFDDVTAFLQQLEPPTFPNAVDEALVAEGKVLFLNNCAKCHGTYEQGAETYPNLLVDVEVVRTDPLLAQTAIGEGDFTNWWNNGWFGQSDASSQFVPTNSYIAPPLDGVWATAPYLHNGSVPNLETLLNSSSRPAYWSRDFDNPNYDMEAVGWEYQVETAGGGKQIYDTTLPGYSNEGHYYGDVLDAEQRAALIEYLKTL